MFMQYFGHVLGMDAVVLDKLGLKGASHVFVICLAVAAVAVHVCAAATYIHSTLGPVFLPPLTSQHGEEGQTSPCEKLHKGNMLS
jgi:hypothetical protein